MPFYTHNLFLSYTIMLMSSRFVLLVLSTHYLGMRSVNDLLVFDLLRGRL